MAKIQSTRPNKVATPKSITAAKRKRVVKEEEIDGSASPGRAAKSIKQEMRDCDICAETKPLYRNFPMVSSCDHDNTVCSSCLHKNFVTRIEASREIGWSACSCPLCGEAVDPAEAQGVVPRNLSKEINAMVKKAQTQSALNWLWCPGQECGQGQLVELTKKPWVSCRYCHTKICFNHQRKWHEGMTCAEFDTASNQDEAIAKNLQEIKQSTKPCPHCKVRVKKDGGCNHMICGTCRKHWMWNDVPFDGETTGTSAETAGGPQVNRALGLEEREAVEQVMRFENAQIDNFNPVNQALRAGLAARPFGLNLQPLLALQNRVMHFFNRDTGVPPEQQPGALRPERLPLMPTPAGTQRVVQQEHMGFPGRVNTGTNIINNLIRRPEPVSAMRTTQNQSQENTLQPARQVASIRAAPTTTRDGRQSPRARRVRRVERVQREVIDLTTGEDEERKEVIDLTGED